MSQFEQVKYLNAAQHRSDNPRSSYVENHRSGRRKSKSMIKVIQVTLFFIMWAIISSLFLGYSALMILYHGNFYQQRDMFVTSVMETGHFKFLATKFLSTDEVYDIMALNTVIPVSGTQDPKSVISGNLTDKQKKDIQIVDVSGPQFKGKLMIIGDPSRVFIGWSKDLMQHGQQIPDIVSEFNAIAGTNGSGFDDPKGNGNGGVPLGLAIKDGKAVTNNNGKPFDIVGFTSNKKMLIGNYTATSAIKAGIQNAVGFGPILILNGKSSKAFGNGGGLNPRTAIGQTNDGRVLLLVIDGRKADSLGASFKDELDIMEKYGAINAVNLDGGNSSAMEYNGKVLEGSALRPLPCAILVRK